MPGHGQHVAIDVCKSRKGVAMENTSNNNAMHVHNNPKSYPNSRYGHHMFRDVVLRFATRSPILVLTACEQYHVPFFM